MEILDNLDTLFEKVFPIISLMILGIGGILCLFGVSTVKHMKWRGTTGWASVASLILVIIYPSFLEFFTFSGVAFSVLPEFLSGFLSFILGLLFPFGLQILILGMTTILLSRTFTYRVKSTPGTVKWIIATLAGVGSCVCFISLYWFTLRSFLTGGESQLIPAFIAVSAGVVVGSVSLLVNLLECTGPRGKD